MIKPILAATLAIALTACPEEGADKPKTTIVEISPTPSPFPSASPSPSPIATVAPSTIKE